MQIKIVLELKEPFCIPVNYNHQLQSAIYRKLSETGASEFWHNEGFGNDSMFKAFVFGPLHGKYAVAGKKLCFSDIITFELRSSVFSFIDSFQRSIELDPSIKLFDMELRVSDYTVSNTHINSNRAIFEAESPVVIRKVLQSGKTVYYTPDDREFIDGLKNNFMKKYEAVAGHPAEKIDIVPIGEHRKVVTKYKGIWVTGYTGRYEVTGNYAGLEFLYNAGMGIKNSQGFGFLKLVQ